MNGNNCRKSSTMKEVNPMETNRARSWELYINAPMPMVTLFKTLDVSNLMQLKSSGYKLNMLMCYCIARAANDTKEFLLLPVGKKMFKYDRIGVNVIVANRNGGINTCDLPFAADIRSFNDSYLKLTEEVYQTCKDFEVEDSMIVGTSSLVKYDLDGVVNMYSGIFNNPFLIWGRYRKEDKATKLQISFQFHHVQMDGQEACEFLERIQRYIFSLK
jgi:chloramphenicol O-acetyltransferase type A